MREVTSSAALETVSVVSVTPPVSVAIASSIASAMKSSSLLVPVPGAISVAPAVVTASPVRASGGLTPSSVLSEGFFGGFSRPAHIFLVVTVVS